MWQWPIPTLAGPFSLVNLGVAEGLEPLAFRLRGAGVGRPVVPVRPRPAQMATAGPTWTELLGSSCYSGRYSSTHAVALQ